MTPIFRIRPMTLRDLDRVMSITRSLKYAPHWPLEVYQDALDPDHRPRRLALVTQEAGGVVAGFAIASLIPPQAELESIVVAPESQREGVAFDLFRVLKSYLKAAKVTEVMLEVRASNFPSLSLYRKLGFAQSGFRHRYYSDPEEDALLFSLSLASEPRDSKGQEGNPNT